MAVAETTSPAVATTAGGSAATTLTTASFSPGAGTVLIAMCIVNWSIMPNPAAPVTVSDSAGGTWTAGPTTSLLTAGARLAVFTRPCVSAPGSITVTMTRGDSAAAMLMLAVRVVTGASTAVPQGASNITAGTVSAGTVNVTTTMSPVTTGGLAYVMGVHSGNNADTAISGTTTIQATSDATDGGLLAVGKSSSTLSAGSQSFGWTFTAVNGDGIVALAVEIVPSGTTPSTVVNQWQATFSQPSAFGTTPPALQSVVVPLNSSTSVGGGTGTPTAGNWLFTIVGMNEQAATSGFTAGVGDDVHSFWRPGDETASTWAVSTASALTRTSIWYTANLARAPQDVYVAPNGCFDALTVLVIEVSGLGPWDTVTAINTNYAAAATSLSLALGAPSAQAFLVAAVAGDSTIARQVFAPASWTPLHTVNASNGYDNTSDSVLTSAWITTSGAVSVSGTATTAEDLSGVVIGVLTSAPSPVPAGNNPNWPYLRFEAAFGGGFQTPQDQLTWTDLTSRLWSWNETTGIQYQLGSIQATEVELELDNFDGNLSPDNTSSPYYPNVVTGTPVRLRGALGVIGGVTVNRWYVIQRNLEHVGQQVDTALRRMVTATATDIWSTLSASGPTPYRGEVQQDSPYAWWPGDDQPLAGGVQPTSLKNAASGNTNVLTIIASPNGTGPTNAYGTDGFSFGKSPYFYGASVGVAVYAVAQQQGWMYGDPQSSPASYQTSNPVTANPGSAAWQTSGQAGNTGGNGWFLSCNDAGFPPLSAGVTVEGWFSYPFFGTTTANNTSGFHVIAQQPDCPLTLFALTTGSAPVAILQLDTSGHLQLLTYNGTTPTTNSIYTASDLRDNSWHHYAVTLTTTAWTVYMDGGLAAKVSGTAAGMTSAWSWLVANGDMGSTQGGGTTSSIQHSGNVSISHLAVYPSRLPTWRILARYCAAITGFGVIPAPTTTGLQLTDASTNSGTSHAVTPDGIDTATVGPSYGATRIAFSFSAVVVAQAGGYTSGPSARAATGGVPSANVVGTGDAVLVSWTGIAPSFAIYTATQPNSETQASVTASNSDDFASGYGASASAFGVGHTAAGSGSSPPAAASGLGDTAAQRIERCLGYGNVTYPGRCVDPASLLVQAATDIGGQQAGANLTGISQSDGGLLFIDNLGNMSYWQKSHLAAQYPSPVWTLTPNAPPASGAPLTAIPYYREGFSWLEDPQRVFNVILIQPFSPDGASLADITPVNAASVNTSQKQYGAQPRQITSYLQSATEMQTQANWMFQYFGTAQIRVDDVKVDAAPYPAAWPLVLGGNVSDVSTVQNWQIGGGGPTGTFRITQIKRKIIMGEDVESSEASVTLTCDFEPPAWWA